MSSDGVASNVAPNLAWDERAAERSPLVRRSRNRGIEQARVIVDAARQLIERQGEFTTQELVKEAGIALQTFYRYFGSKDQLLLALIEQMVGGQAAAMEAEAAAIEDPLARLHFYVTAPLHFLADEHSRGSARAITAEHWRLHQLFPDAIEDASRPMVELLRRTLVDAQAAGSVTANDAERDAWLMVEIVRSTFHHYAFAELEPSLDAVAEHVWTFCLRGVGGDPPRLAQTMEGRVDG